MLSSEQSQITQSGLSESIPDILAYPRIPFLNEVREEMLGQFVYVIKGYKEDGLSVLIKRSSNNVYVKIGDFDGNTIDVSNANHKLYKQANEFVTNESYKFVNMMKMLGIEQLLFYISVDSDQMMLVDLRASLNKFYGPGMLQDLFSKFFNVQKVIKTIHVTEEVLSTIKKNEGSFKGDIILKCSKFKTVEKNRDLLPLYAKINRS